MDKKKQQSVKLQILNLHMFLSTTLLNLVTETTASNMICCAKYPSY